MQRLRDPSPPQSAPAPHSRGGPLSSRPRLSEPAISSLFGDDDPESVGPTLVGVPVRVLLQQGPVRHAYITIIAGSRAGEMFRADQSVVLLGRDPQAQIHLDGEGVSRKHAQIVRRGNDYFIEDLHSTNGTWIGERRIESHRLADGDLINVGTDMIVRFDLHDAIEAELQHQLFESAVRDTLTRSYNRRYFQERIRAEVASAGRHATPLTLIILDIDFFKKVNDTYGHSAGDAVLRALCAMIQRAIRVEDVFARIGGEEFALIARGIDTVNGLRFAERIRRGVERLHIPWAAAPGGAIAVTASFGVASVSELEAADADQLFAQADARLYEAKGGGRNRTVGAT